MRRTNAAAERREDMNFMITVELRPASWGAWLRLCFAMDRSDLRWGVREPNRRKKGQMRADAQYISP
jgi:hypothetical protein